MTTNARLRPQPSDLARHWLIDPEMVFLNHGSFGACPRAVLEVQSRLREEMEREPVRFFAEGLMPLLDQARQSLASFVSCDPEDLVFTTNATTGIATILAHLRDHLLTGGGEILLTSHEYPACANNIRHIAALTSSAVVSANIPFPIQNDQQAIDAILDAVTKRTRVALISHVTAPTGLVLPVEKIVPELESRGIAVIIDGAHAPGMVKLDLAALGASFYTANCHKWLCAPKGAAFIHVGKKRQIGHAFRPLVLSNLANKPIPDRKHMLTEFDYTGTQDYTPWACIPETLGFMETVVEGGWPAIYQRNHNMAVRARRMLCEELGMEPPAPESMLGALATIILPSHDPERTARIRSRPTRYNDALQDALLERWKIQIPVWGLPDKPERFVRHSAQLYNAPEQYEYLAHALREEFTREQAM